MKPKALWYLQGPGSCISGFPLSILISFCCLFRSPFHRFAHRPLVKHPEHAAISDYHRRLHSRSAEVTHPEGETVDLGSKKEWVFWGVLSINWFQSINPCDPSYWDSKLGCENNIKLLKKTNKQFRKVAFPETLWINLIAHLSHGCSKRHEPAGFSMNQECPKHCNRMIISETLQGQPHVFCGAWSRSRKRI